MSSIEPHIGHTRQIEGSAQVRASGSELTARVGFTDDLIDQIVYKLYGLTEEEIAIVEGRV